MIRRAIGHGARRLRCLIAFRLLREPASASSDRCIKSSRLYETTIVTLVQCVDVLKLKAVVSVEEKTPEDKCRCMMTSS